MLPCSINSLAQTFGIQTILNPSILTRPPAYSAPESPHKPWPATAVVVVVAAAAAAAAAAAVTPAVEGAPEIG